LEKKSKKILKTGALREKLQYKEEKTQDRLLVKPTVKLRSQKGSRTVKAEEKPSRGRNAGGEKHSPGTCPYVAAHWGGGKTVQGEQSKEGQWGSGNRTSFARRERGPSAG